VIFAFKFLSKKRIGLGEYERRELREYYKVWDTIRQPTDFACNYDGTTYLIVEGKRQQVNMDDYAMPFSTRHAKTVDISKN
jgi:hypothetical protein